MLRKLFKVPLIDQASGVLTFNYFDLLDHNLDADLSFLLMCGFFIAFIVKLPSFPFHTWLPDAHTQAPTAASVLLAGRGNPRICDERCHFQSSFLLLTC